MRFFARIPDAKNAQVMDETQKSMGLQRREMGELNGPRSGNSRPNAPKGRLSRPSRAL